jgi:hypothetical protein
MLVYEQQFIASGVASRWLYILKDSSIDYRHYQKRPLNDPVSLLITSINEFKPMMAEVSIPLELILDFYKGIITAKYKKHRRKGVFDLT